MADVHIYGELAALVSGGLAADPVTVAPIGVMDAIVLAPAAGTIIPIGRRANIRKVSIDATLLALVPAPNCVLFTIWTTDALGVVQNRWFIGIGSGAANDPWAGSKTFDVDMPIDATLGPITINAAVGSVMIVGPGSVPGPVSIALAVRVD